MRQKAGKLTRSECHAHDGPHTYAVSLGGDTDTIGAMTGAIAGALHGVEAIPAEWYDALENSPKGRDYVGALASRLFERHAELRGQGA